MIAVRSHQVLSDHPPLSDGRFDYDKAEAREFMYCCVVSGKESHPRKRRRLSSGQAEGAAPSRFSKRLAVRAKAIRSGDVVERKRLSAPALPSRRAEAKYRLCPITVWTDNCSPDFKRHS